MHNFIPCTYMYNVTCGRLKKAAFVVHVESFNMMLKRFTRLAFSKLRLLVLVQR